MRFIRGITLTDAERQKTGISPSGGNGMIREHACSVTMPDGRSCSVSYTRVNPRSHKFLFQSPILQQIWIDPRLDNTAEAIEAKAQEVAAEAFRRAQAQEQKDRRSRTQQIGRASCRVRVEISVG